MKAKPKTAIKTATKKRYEGFSDEEKAAMQTRVQEMKVAGAGRVDPDAQLLAKVAEMEEPDRATAKRLHAIVKKSAPNLTSTLWYGMPAYARNGKIVCFFQPARKFKTRYSTLGFNDPAHLDDGNMWPTAYALTTKLTAADEARIGALVKKAAD